MTKSDFYSRFGIKIDVTEARRRFINRVYNKIFDEHLNERAKQRPDVEEKFLNSLADVFGERTAHPRIPDMYVGGNFERVLQAVELLWEIDPHYSYEDRIVSDIIDGSEASVGIRWELGKFYPQGDELLDKKLVADPLDRLRKRGHPTVTAPFEKALRHLLTGEKDPAILADAITDAYEALEAMAKIVTQRHERDLSGNAELFLSRLGVSEEYNRLLGLYLDYANRFRHAPSASRPRPGIRYKEAESFIYMTGVFLRLASS